MKLRYYMAVLLTVLFTTTAFAQKDKVEIDYDKKTDIATVDGKQVFKIVKETKMGGITYIVQSLEGKTLITFMPIYYKDAREISQSNPDGKVSYHDIIFEDAPDLKCDYKWFTMNQAIKLIYDSKLIVDGKLDAEAAKMFARKQGTVQTEKRRDAR